MQKNIILIFLIFCNGLFFQNCTQNSKNQEKRIEEADSSIEINSVAQSNTKTDSLAIDFKSNSLSNSQNIANFKIELDTQDFDYPKSNISVSFGNKTIKIATITGGAELIDKKNYAEKEIPSLAITACGAWWAGAGDYFYIINSKTGIIVFKGWQDETQDDKGFHWKKIKEIDL